MSYCRCPQHALPSYVWDVQHIKLRIRVKVRVMTGQTGQTWWWAARMTAICNQNVLVTVMFTIESDSSDSTLLALNASN